MTMSISELERLNHLQTAELGREERRFLARLQNLGLLRSRCDQFHQQRDKIEKLSSLHDKLLQQEFTLRKLRRIRSEVDSQRQRNEKLAKELGKFKEELEEKEATLRLVKVNLQKPALNGSRKESEPARLNGFIDNHPGEITKAAVGLAHSNKTVTTASSKQNLAAVENAGSTLLPAPVPLTSASTNGSENKQKNGRIALDDDEDAVAGGSLEAASNSKNNGNGNHTGDQNESDSEELVTSFITGWAPSLKKGDESFFPNRYSATDADLLGNSSFNNENKDDTTDRAENARPASDFISLASRGIRVGERFWPTYRYVPRTQTFLRRIGVDGGRKKTVESLYKDFHPRALQSATSKSTPVSILDESDVSITSVSSGSNGAGVAVKTGNGTSFDAERNIDEEGGQKQQAVRSILVTEKTVVKKSDRRVRFDPLALLLDAALDGDLDLVKQLLREVPDPSAANDEGITALHNAICAGHSEMVGLLVEYGVDVNAADTDGWTGLHCAASCNNKDLCQLLVENGAAVFALTTPDRETPRDKCEPDEDGFAECYAYLLEVEEQLGHANDCIVYAAFDFLYSKEEDNDDVPFDTDILQFRSGATLKILRRGDAVENDWWWASLVKSNNDDLSTINQDEVKEGYVPNSYLALWPCNKSFQKRYSHLLKHDIDDG